MQFSLTHPVEAPPQKVFDVMTDVDGFQHWMPNFVRVEKLTEGALDVGSVFLETRRMYGRDSTEHFECTRFEAPHRFDLLVDGTKGTTGKGEFRFSHRVEGSGSGSMITIEGEITGMGVMGKLFGFAFKPMMRKALRKDFEALGAYVESLDAAG
jgi:carbon monoxide dehydrogenase subunit G